MNASAHAEKLMRSWPLPNAGLSAQVPDLEFDVFVCYCFHIEANG